jgi:uncharacterized protein YqeY
MNKKEQIQQDFIAAFKAKDDTKKAALSSVKVEIMALEKSKSEKEVGDDEVMRIIASGIKKRKQSIAAFTEGGRLDLVEQEQAEVDVLQEYMPAQMSREDIATAARQIIQDLPQIETNPHALIGKTMGAFGKQFAGQADMKTVKEVVTDMVQP